MALGDSLHPRRPTPTPSACGKRGLGLSSVVYELSIETEFCAAHAILIGGVREAVHGHNFRVTVVVGGPELNGEGLLCDFHAVQAALHPIISRLNNTNLNEIEPFDRVNPTAERIAWHIGEALKAKIGPTLPPGVGVRSVRVTESPGCAAVYWLGR